MLRQSIITAAVLFTLTLNANPELEDNPIATYISEQIETLELELELFGTQTNDDIISIETLDVYEVEEEVQLNFDTSAYLPKDFNPREGMDDIDWSTIEIYEVEEEVNFDFDVRLYLPHNFNPYRGMSTYSEISLCLIK